MIAIASESRSPTEKKRKIMIGETLSSEARGPALIIDNNPTRKKRMKFNINICVMPGYDSPSIVP